MKFNVTAYSGMDVVTFRNSVVPTGILTHLANSKVKRQKSE